MITIRELKECTCDICCYKSMEEKEFFSNIYPVIIIGTMYETGVQREKKYKINLKNLDLCSDCYKVSLDRTIKSIANGYDPSFTLFFGDYEEFNFKD